MNASAKARELMALRVVRPEEWRRTVRRALRATGDVPAAAVELGISTRTLWRWLKDVPSLRQGVPLPPAGNPAVVRAQKGSGR